MRSKGKHAAVQLGLEPLQFGKRCFIFNRGFIANFGCGVEHGGSFRGIIPQTVPFPDIELSHATVAAL